MHAASASCLLLLPLLAAGGCGGESSAGTEDPLAFMQLDQGRRWRADAHTKQSIAAMMAAMQAASGDESPARTAALGEELRKLGDQLVAGCTMTGPAHDALHGYLGVLLPRLREIGQADPDQAAAARTAVTEILARFDTWFE